MMTDRNNPSEPPLVSIGLPVYNAATYLDQALASLSAQDFASLEILASDNASTDQTPDILARWAAKDPRIKIVRQPRNLGMGGNFSYVRNHARANLYIQAAHDDLWSPTFVTSLYAARQRAPDSLLVVPTVDKMHPDGSHDRRTSPPDLNCLMQRKRIACLLRLAQSGWSYGLFERRALLDSEAARDRFGFEWGNEFVTMLPMILSGRVATCPDAIYFQRQTGSSEERYKPKDLATQKKLRSAFAAEVAQAVQNAGLSTVDRLLLWPALERYIEDHAWKKRRIWRATFSLRRDNGPQPIC